MTESKYNSVARTFYCKTLSKSPCEGRMQWSEEGQKKLPRLRKRKKKEERKKENEQRSQDKMFIT